MRTPWFGYRTLDHAGREIALAGFAPSPVDDHRDQTRDPDLHRLRHRVRALARRRVSARTLVLIACVVGPLLGVTLVLGRTGAPVTWPVGIAVLSGLGVMVWLFHRDERRGINSRSSVIVTAFLCESRCPGCGYSLLGTPADVAGQVCCPECSARWRAEAIHAPIRPTPPLRGPRTALGRELAEADKSRPGGRVIMDAVGRALVIPDPSLRSVLPEHVAMLGPSRVHAVRREIRKAAIHRIGLRFVIYGVMAAVPIAALASGVAPQSPNAVLSPAAGAVIAGVMLACFLGMALYDMIVRGGALQTAHLAEILLRHGICPACLNAMDAAPQRDGGTECPGCGANWSDTPVNPREICEQDSGAGADQRLKTGAHEPAPFARG